MFRLHRCWNNYFPVLDADKSSLLSSFASGRRRGRRTTSLQRNEWRLHSFICLCLNVWTLSRRVQKRFAICIKTHKNSRDEPTNNREEQRRTAEDTFTALIGHSSFNSRFIDQSPHPSRLRRSPDAQRRQNQGAHGGPDAKKINMTLTWPHLQVQVDISAKVEEILLTRSVHPRVQVHEGPWRLSRTCWRRQNWKHEGLGSSIGWMIKTRKRD